VLTGLPSGDGGLSEGVKMSVEVEKSAKRGCENSVGKAVPELRAYPDRVFSAVEAAQMATAKIVLLQPTNV